jgi:polyisoprenoid-binding protein YceI
MTTPTATTMIGTYNADPVHSTLGFSVRYQGVSVFRGTLTEVDAKLVDGRLEGAAPVESISITTPETFRAHLLSAEFFDAKAHPEVKFVSTALDVQEDGRARISGDLTMKGVTKPVHAIGTWTAPATDASGNARANLDVEAVIDRTEWGINWNAPLPSGGKAVGNEVTLTISLSLLEDA